MEQWKPAPSCCVAFGGDAFVEQADDNLQVVRLIAAMGTGDSGRRAILKAVAMKQGIVEENAIEDLINGKSDTKAGISPHGVV